MKKGKITLETNYKGHPIMFGTRKSRQGFHQEILDNNLDIMLEATERHNKILAGRFDVRFPQDVDDVAEVNKKFIASYVKRLKRDGLDPRYAWAREQTEEDARPHFHYMLLLDGSKTRDFSGALSKAEKALSGVIDAPATGLIHHCDKSSEGWPCRNAIMLRRGEPDFRAEFDEFYRRASYLAKVESKKNAPTGERQFGGSKKRKPKGA